MKLDISIENDVTVLAVSGALNRDSVARFKRAVGEALDQQRRDFVIDLSKVVSVDSAGLEILTDLHRQCEEQLGMVRVCGADETMSKIFEMTRLDKQFELHENVAAALGSFAQHAVTRR